MVPFYTPCYVQVNNSALGTVRLLMGAAILAFNLIHLLFSYGFVRHLVPAIDVLF